MDPPGEAAAIRARRPAGSRSGAAGSSTATPRAGDGEPAAPSVVARATYAPRSVGTNAPNDAWPAGVVPSGVSASERVPSGPETVMAGAEDSRAPSGPPYTDPCGASSRRT